MDEQIKDLDPNTALDDADLFLIQNGSSNENEKATAATVRKKMNQAESMFSAYLSANQSIANVTSVKLGLDVPEFDIGGDYDNVTNFRFTAPVAGVYNIKAQVTFGGAATIHIAMIFRNGVEYRRGDNTSALSASVDTDINLAAGDYLEFFVYQNSGGAQDALGGTAPILSYVAAKLISYD